VGPVVLAWLGNQKDQQILLAFCFMVGTAWRCSDRLAISVSEQVPAETITSAVALNGISYNIARSFGRIAASSSPRPARSQLRRKRRALYPATVVLFLWRPTPASRHDCARASPPRHGVGRALKIA